MIARVSHTIIIDICPLKICFSVAIVAQADFYQGTAAALIRMPCYCRLCRWRACVLPRYQGEDPHPSVLLMDTEDALVLRDTEDPLRTRKDRYPAYRYLVELWVGILRTETLWAPTTGFAPNGTRWYRFLCRGMRPISSTSSSHLSKDYIEDGYGNRIESDEYGMFTMWKCVPLSRLEDILSDGGMWYGTLDVPHRAGVYVEASPPWIDFDGWEMTALLQLRMHANITEAPIGIKGFYVLMFDQIKAFLEPGCGACEVLAIYVSEDHVPEFVDIEALHNRLCS